MAFGGTENSAYSDSLRGGNAAVERMGIVRFLELAAKRSGAENRRYPDPYRTHSFLLGGWLDGARQFDRKPAGFGYSYRPLPSARTRTLLTLFRNALAVIISTITIMIVLSEIGVNIAPLLAGAGALGLAISFGSQTLVKDIITGVFIQFENGMNTGDLVTIGPLTGTVERMSIRSVGVRQDTGAYHIIPWSSITTFANFVRGIGSVVANYDVDRHEDADKANQALKDAVAELMENEEIRGLVIGEPNFAGIVGLSNTAFTLRVSFTTLPLKQWTVRFALDSQVKKHFDLAGVRAPVQTYQVLPARARPRLNRCRRGSQRFNAGD